MSSTITTPLLDQERWDVLFSKDFYEKCKKNDASIPEQDRLLAKLNSLKYLIALSSDDGHIVKFIDSLKSKQSPQISSPYTEHQITALHMAVMKNRPAVIDCLVSAGANPNAQDKYGWTPLHHAALISEDLVKHILAKGVDPKTRNLKGGTCEDLVSLIKKVQSAAPKVLYQTTDGAPESLSLEDLSSRLSIEYTNQCQWPLSMLYHLWTSPHHPTEDFFQHQVRQLYPSITKNPPKLIIKEEAISEGHVFRGVIAGETLSPFSLIGEYTGEIIIVPDEQEGEGTYSFILERMDHSTLSVDAKTMGNWTRYMNDGFPTVVAFDLYNSAGQTCRKIFLAGEEGIAEGSSLCYDYGCTFFTLKWEKPYSIANKGQVASFFTNFEEHCKTLKQLYDELVGHYPYTQLLAFRLLEAQLLYPFQTPWVLIYLTFSEVIDPAKWLAFVEQQEQPSDSSSSSSSSACSSSSSSSTTLDGSSAPSKQSSSFSTLFTYPQNNRHEDIKNLLQALSSFKHLLEILSKGEEGAKLVKRVKEHFLGLEGTTSADRILIELITLNASRKESIPDICQMIEDVLLKPTKQIVHDISL